MYKALYAKTKPEDCRNCRFGNSRGGCILGKNNCFYITRVIRKIKDPCDGCPYSRGGPCIGWCTKKVIGETNEKVSCA